MGGHGDSQALPTVFCAPETATSWVPVTSPIPTLTPLPAGAPAPTFLLPTDVPALATLPPHGETDPDGPMGGDGAFNDLATATLEPTTDTTVDDLTTPALPADWGLRSKRAKKHWYQSHRN